MSLGHDVVNALGSTGQTDTPLRVYECESCGRAFARTHTDCPACDGLIKEVVLS